MTTNASRSPEDLTPQPITLADVLHALFLAPELRQRPRPERAPRWPAPEPTQVEQIEEPYTPDLPPEPVWIEAAQQPIQWGFDASLARRAGLALGTLAALGLALPAQRALTDLRKAGAGATLYALALAAWLGVLLFEIGPKSPDSLLRRGPRVRGRQGALSIPMSRDRMYVTASAIAFSVATFTLTGDNTFTLPGVVVWLASIGLWILSLSEADPRAIWDKARQVKPDFGNWRLPKLQAWLWLAAIVAVTALGAYFRLYRLDGIPPEMTSDHVEKLLDAWNVSNGQYLIFFPNNGGREAIQMYLVALGARLFGTGFDFLTLKLVSALEGLALIPLMVVVGREVVDRETGLYAAGLLAISWWHTSLSRMGLRIVLTPLITALVLIALARGMRTGVRRHFVLAGVWLGIGLFSYQAMRMTLLLAPLGVGLTLFGLGAGNSRPSRMARLNWGRRQLLNLLVVGLIAFAIAVPMLRFGVDEPDLLWNRVITRVTSKETPLAGPPLAILANNMVRALLMFNWQGDVAWISGLPSYPALDLLTGGLFVLGVAAWIVRVVVRRDPVDALILLGIPILLLPSALALAFPVENPSLTRASGVIPLVFLIAAWPLALIRQRWTTVFEARFGPMLAGVLIALWLVGAALVNREIYFERYYESYRRSALNPSEVAAALRDMLGRDHPLDNVFLQGYPFWHDYRAIGIEAGDITWSNAIFDAERLKQMLKDDPRLTDGRVKIFIVHPADKEGQAILADAYPDGSFNLFKSAVEGRDFYLFVVPGE
jgi:hypothetical protein